MIIKKFTFLLLVITLIQIGCTNNSQQEKIISDLIHSIETSNLEVETLTTEIINQSNLVLRDEVKRKYRPIGEVISTINNKIDSISYLVEEMSRKMENGQSNNYLNEIESISKNLNNLQLELREEYETLLVKHEKQFGLTPDDIKKLQKKNTEFLQKNNVVLSRNDLKTLDQIHFQILLVKTKLDLKNIKLRLIKELNILIGGKPIECYFGIFPEIIPKNSCIKIGEKFEASIGIKPHDFEILPEDIKLFVNNKPLKFEKGRFNQFSSDIIQEEKTTILISCKVRDKITGEFMEAFTNFEYDIIAN